MPRLLEWSLACALVCGAGCTSKSNKAGAEEAGDRPAGELSGDGPSATSRDDRIPAPGGAVLGAHAGHLPGAFAYGSFEVGAAHRFLSALPFDPRTARELDEAREQLGVDLLSPQLPGLIGVDPAATLSMSARLLDGGDSELYEAWIGSGAAITELRARAERQHEADPLENEELAAEPPALSPDAQQLVRRARSMGVHLRAQLPVRDMNAARAFLQRLIAADARDDPRWAEACAALGPSLLCEGRSDGVFVLREQPGGLQLDMLLAFAGDYEHPDSPERRALMQQSLALGAATPAHVAALRGQVGASIDGPGVVAMMRAEGLARAINQLAEGYGGSSSRHRARDEAIARLHETERLFAGIAVEGELAADAMVLRGRWLPTAQGRARAAEVFALTEIDADVPTIAALCTGALICGRSRGVPSRERFAALAQGVYADPRALSAVLDRFEEDSMAIALLETWPNIIGASRLLPGTLVGPGESMVINNAIGVLTRVLGFGFSVRSLDEVGRGLSGDYVAYARLSAADLAAMTGMMKLAEFTPMPTKLDGVNAQVSFAPLPERELAGNFYSLAEPDAGAGAWGWAVIADGDDRVRWLGERAHDDGATPLIYAEMGDLWRLVASFQEGPRELGFARDWLSQRWLRAQIDIGEDGLPEARFAMGKR